ncbi:glycosyltransferase|uniref:Processive 1,2-diacylglycerol beta-glucosyltransferase n=1 Tax=Dendrosporobacter quercicolus TaxID=146817 RepID=A0A1G9MLT6_9FIRM|nr:glycosyltransferase [Dendrosporobacter quercicolus]NSL47075.1 glycosyltransferase [Dendrosporobacter quercicolus DSM 1736]SDL75094.1 processive 1,2-diacylglycerol beta-glucosyltransferase [Dendrosporobacter quercicolus]
MAKPAKVLFISAPVGAGHVRAAAAINQALNKLRPDTATSIVNVFDFFSQFWGQALLKAYLQCLRFFPGSYGKMYGWGNTSRLALWGREAVSAFFAGRMLHYIELTSPALIVCTHATPAGLVAYLKKHHKINIPAIAVVTDFVVHRLWIYPEIDCYFVANEELLAELERFHITPAQSHVAGIPIDSAFSQPPARDQLMGRLGLCAAKKTILMMGGGAGILPMQEIALALNRLAAAIQVIVVTGQNDKLHKDLENIKPKLTFDLKITGFVDNVAELMAVADVLISKPGGMTAAEALSSRLPLIIYRPIPGQEEGNSKFLLARRVAMRAESVEDLLALLHELFTDGNDTLAVMRKNTVRIARPEAAREIAATITARYLSGD